VSRERGERELAAEIESHLQLHIDDNLRAGLPPDEARRAALIKFGPVEAIKQEYRDRGRLPAADALWLAIRHGFRRLYHDRWFTLTAAATLAVGIGANAAMFRLVEALMFRPPDHVRDPDRVVRVESAGNYVRYRDLAARSRTLDLAAYANVVEPWPRSRGPSARRRVRHGKLPAAARDADCPRERVRSRQ
jgi:hypothetical protein